MPYFNPYNMMSLARAFHTAMGVGYTQATPINGVDVMIEAMKQQVDNNPYWTQCKKDTYKLLADCAKDRIKGNRYV